MTATVTLSNVKKTYGDQTVLDIDAFEFEAGTTYAVVGPNGAGKSTLLRIIAGTLDASEGTVAIPSGLSVGYLPQKPYVFGFSVFKNIAMALDNAGLDKNQVKHAVDEALEAVGMSDFAQARGTSLSGGEAQRVALARLLVARHDVLLLDEPTSAMDIKGTVAVEQALSDYLQRNNTTLIVSTHAPSQALRVTEQAVVLVDGKIAETDATAKVLENPSDERVAEFLSYWRL